MLSSICIETIFREVPLEQRFESVRKAGFDYVEFWSWDDKDIGAIKKLLRKYDLKVASFSGDKEYSPIDSTHEEKYLEFAEQSAVAANELGCRYLVIHSNALGEGGRVVNHYADTDPYVLYGSMQKCLSKLAVIAEKYNVTYVLEPLNTKYDHEGNFLKHTKDAANIVRTLGSSRIRILYDVYHMQIMEGDIVNTLENYQNEIGYIHFADVPLRSEPGTGEINFTAILSKLSKLRYEGFLGYELFPVSSSDMAIQSIRHFEERI